jgi:peptidyl-prolyl cis-trans isomerase A (cyclophilin A)
LSQIIEHNSVDVRRFWLKEMRGFAAGYVLGPIMFLVLMTGAYAQEPSSPVRIRIETVPGIIIAELYPDKAPITVANFLRYVDGGFFDGGCFMRTVRPGNEQNPVKIQVIQAVVHPWKENNSYPPIALERTNTTGLLHVDGAISMARGGPNSATSSFFICVGGQPELDFGGKRNPDGQGFAAFGRVTQGMDVVRKIQMSAAEGQAIVPPVTILRVARITEQIPSPKQ